MTKTEFYNKLASLTKKTGQGLELKFAQMIPGFSMDMLNEMIADGILVMYHHNFSHLPDSDWICIKGIYNPEEKDRDTRGLTFMRYYLGLPDDMIEKFAGNVGKTREDVIADYMDDYKKFLMENLEGLEAIKRLDTDRQLDDSLSKETIFFLKERTWYKNNISVEEALSKSNEAYSIERKKLSLTKELNRLYRTDPKYNKELENNEKEIVEIETELKLRARLNNVMSSCKDKSVKVQEVFK